MTTSPDNQDNQLNESIVDISSVSYAIERKMTDIYTSKFLDGNKFIENMRNSQKSFYSMGRSSQYGKKFAPLKAIDAVDEDIDKEESQKIKNLNRLNAM